MFSGCHSLESIELNNFNTNLVNNMKGMFSECKTLKYLDLSSFNTLSVTDMSWMFSGCHSLESIELNNFNTNLVNNMKGMFSECKTLKYLDLSSFNTLSVTDMSLMFSGCHSLLSLNLTNLFNTSLVIYMNGMFSECNSLISLNLSNFKTSFVINMTEMFYNCSTLKILNLNNFNTSNVKYMKNMFSFCSSLKSLNLISFKTISAEDISGMFYNCTSLISLNLNNFYISNSTNINEILNSCNKNLIICINNTEYNFQQNYYYEYTNNCSHICFSDSKKIILDINKCVNSCSEEYNYTFEYNDVCYKSCPKKTKSSKNNTKECEDLNCENYYNYEQNDCINTIEEGFYNNDTKDKTIDKCHNDCRTCDKKDTINNSNCLSCKDSKKFFDSGNCVTSCYYGYFIDNNGNKICLFNNSFNYIFKQYNQIENSSKKDNIINNIKNEIKNGNFDLEISNLLGGERKDLVGQDDNIIYQITSSENQNNNNYENISTMILGECEKLLKEEYHIKENQSLLIFKIDYYLEGSLIPIIGYDVFHPETKKPLDLTICEKANIKLNIPASINEEKLFRYNPNNEYYQDECYPSTTDNGTDILINDRHNEYNANNMSLCEQNCSFIEYDTITKKSKCECGIKSKQLFISELINKTDILYYNFDNKKESSNMVTMKCYYTLFTKSGLIKNIGSYILLFTILFFMISLILFYKCGYLLLEEDIKEIIEQKNENNKHEEMNIKETIDIVFKGKKIFKKNKKNSKKKKKLKKNINKTNSKSFSKYELKNNKGIISPNKSIKQNKLLEKYNQQTNSVDYELNSFSYSDAIKYDKRTFFNYYFSLIKTKQLLLFSFCPIKDYNSRIIKIDLFFLAFSIYCFINCIFFDEPTIHKIYKEEGVYNFNFFILHILYSFIISHTLYTIIKYFSLSEKNICEIKKEKSIELSNDKVSNVKRCLIIKYICFYAISLVFLFFFWYYLSSFGAVYRNTQIFLIKNILISFSFSLFYPFIINILPGVLRIYSLYDPNRICVYKLSKIIQYL